MAQGHLPAAAMASYRRSRLPFASPGIVLLWWFKPAVCQPAKPPKCFPAAPMPFASPGIVLLWWFKPAVCQPAKGDDEAPQLVALARQAQQLPEISTLDYP